MIVREKVYNDYLFHHGIKGQKWGVRRYQNDDGSLTDEGKRRYAKKNLKKAIVRNLEKWGQDRDHNVLYLTGASGSGKSTTALGLSNKNDSIIHLDTLLDDSAHSTDANYDFENFCKSKGIDVDRARDLSIDKKDRWRVIDAISDQIEPYGKKCFDEGRKVVAEGVQLADETMFPNKSYFDGRPFVALKTGKTISSVRAAIRDNDRIKDILKDAFNRERANWYDYIQENVDKI